MPQHVPSADVLLCPKSPVPDAPLESLFLDYEAPDQGYVQVLSTSELSASITGSCASAPTSFCTTAVLTGSSTAAADTVSDVQVVVDVDHPYVGELVLTLTHDGRSVELVANPSSATGQVGRCAAANFQNLHFSDRASDSVTSQCFAGFTGSFRPRDFLSTFAGTSMAGDWSLEVQDTVKAFSFGSLRRFALIIGSGTREHSSWSGTASLSTWLCIYSLISYKC